MGINLRRLADLKLKLWNVQDRKARRTHFERISPDRQKAQGVNADSITGRRGADTCRGIDRRHCRTRNRGTTRIEHGSRNGAAHRLCLHTGQREREERARCT